MKQLLIKNGFKVNIHRDAYDKGNFRVYFDDTMIHVVKFNDPKIQLVEWNSAIDGNMGKEKAMKVIEAMTA